MVASLHGTLPWPARDSSRDPDDRPRFREAIIDLQGYWLRPVPRGYPAAPNIAATAAAAGPRGADRTPRDSDVFADPLACDCLYVGDKRAWGNYQRGRIQLQLANKGATEVTDWEAGPRGP